MALINTVIVEASFEIILKRIALILRSEIINQVVLTGDYDIDATVFLERTVKINTSELDSGPVIVVCLATGDFNNQDITQSAGTYQYFIDVYTKAKTSAIGAGDTRARLRCQRMLGVCRAILEATQYITLGFGYPFVMGRKINSLLIADPDDTGADSLTRARLVLEVKVPEFNPMSTASLIDGSDTKVFIDITTEGYFWVNDNY